MDALAFEPQFLDHVAPVWTALPEVVRGRFLVDASLVERAASRGIDATPVDAATWRQTPQQPPVHDGIPTLAASIGDIKVGRRLGHGPFTFLEHGCGQSYGLRHGGAPSYAGGPDRADNELFLVPNDYSANLWRSAYPGARVEVVGSPRLDGLPQRQLGHRPVIAISFHGDWPSGVAYGGNAFADYVMRLPDLAKRYTLIGHGHPGKGWPARIGRRYARDGIRFVPEFEDVCREADVYVCDNSSTIFEFASTGRPVVLLNAHQWNRRGGPGLRFWDAAHVGINVWPKDDLFAAIDEALEDPPERQRDREDALRFVYAYRSGGAERAARAVVDWLADRADVAA